jgi:hypothetical protein
MNSLFARHVIDAMLVDRPLMEDFSVIRSCSQYTNTVYIYYTYTHVCAAYIYVLLVY